MPAVCLTGSPAPVLPEKGTQRDRLLHGKRARHADLKVYLRTKSVSRNGQSIILTPKEYNLLLFFVQNPERILTRTEIAEKVWDTHFDTGTNFIDVYINYLRKKIDKNFNTKLIHTKPGMGFIFSYENPY